ncbi:MAG: tRNA lysidine(34) synthetase TilS, partial [Gammaproteobacteria bacterium]|nr:tRNA lysidine(34) synthetase TilS [Gammaproteobacteria bacterium]
QSLSLNVKKSPGESLEAAARDARYAAFKTLVGEGDLLLTAHHQDDQAETLLLQLLRGAGPAGLASMPARKPFGYGHHVRPLLAFSRSDLKRYAQQHQLRWIEDSSNQNDDFDRNYLRNQVIPLIQKRWPSMSATLSRSASHCAEAVEILDADVEQVLSELLAGASNTLPVSTLLDLTDAQLKHLLRGWIERLDLPTISHHKLEQVRSDLLNAGPDRMPIISWSGGEFRRYKGEVYLGPPLVAFDSTRRLLWESALPLTLPGGVGEISLIPATAGLNKARVLAGRCEIRFRQGGESIRLAGRGITVTLKQLLQEQATPPWLRDRLPLLFIDDVLAAVGDIVIAEQFIGQEGEVVLEIHLK